MATCPKCGGSLGANHRCWGARWQLKTIGFGLAGGLAGLAAVFLLADRPSEPLVLVTTVLGVVLTLAVRQYARF